MNSFPFAGSSRTVEESSSRNSTNQLEISNGTLLGRILRKTPSARHTEPVRVLEEVIDLERNLDLYQTNQVNLLNPRTLYQTEPLNLRTSLLRINREKQVNVTTEAVNLSIISKDTIKKLKQQNKTLVHLGLIVIGIKGMTRKKIGSKTLIMILDKSWKTDARKALIASIEMDMNSNIKLSNLYLREVLSQVSSGLLV